MSERTGVDSIQRDDSLPRNVKLLGWASFLNDVASEMVYPLMPQFLIGVLGGSRFHLGIIEGVADSVASLLKLWSGAWSDRAGRRKGFVVCGYALATVARPVLGFVMAPWQFLASRVVDRIGKGIRTAPRDAMIADSTVSIQRGRAFGFHRAMDHLGAAVGPLLATAFLWQWPGQLRTLFLVTFVPGLLVVGLVVVGLKESQRRRQASLPENGQTPEVDTVERTLSTRNRQPFDPQFRRYLLALVIFTLGNSSDAFLLLRAGELGIPIVLLPLLWFVFHVAKSAGNLMAGRLVDHIGTQVPIITGWVIYAGVYLGFAYATAAWQAWALFLGYAVFYALTEPAEKKLVTQLVGPDRTGRAFGWYNFAIGISALPASLVFGALYESFGAAVAFGWGATLALVASAVFATVRPPRLTGRLTPSA